MTIFKGCRREGGEGGSGRVRRAAERKISARSADG
jgi:hypothetical protein